MSIKPPTLTSVLSLVVLQAISSQNMLAGTNDLRLRDTHVGVPTRLHKCLYNYASTAFFIHTLYTNVRSVRTTKTSDRADTPAAVGWFVSYHISRQKSRLGRRLHFRIRNTPPRALAFYGSFYGSFFDPARDASKTRTSVIKTLFRGTLQISVS